VQIILPLILKEKEFPIRSLNPMQWSAILEVSDYRDFYKSMVSGGKIVLSFHRRGKEQGEYNRSCSS